MRISEELKNKLTQRYLKKLGEQIQLIDENIIFDLLDGQHSISIEIHGKYTIAEIEYYRNGYNHHFLGIAAKNLNDEFDTNYGIKVAVEHALLNLLAIFYKE